MRGVLSKIHTLGAVFRTPPAPDTYKYVEKKESNTKIFTKKFLRSIFFSFLYNLFFFWKTFCIDFGALFCYNEKKQKICKTNNYAPKGAAMKRSNIRPLGKYSRMILHIELPMVLGCALFFLFSYLHQRIAAPVYAAIEYAPLVAYLIFPLIITAFSVLLIERLQTDKK